MTDQPLNEHPQEQPAHSHQHKPKGRGNGEGSVFKRGGERKKPWVAQITLENNKKQVVGYYKTESEAIAAKNKALRELEQGAWVAHSRQTLSEYLDYWLEHVHKSSLKITTYEHYRRVLDNHLIPAFGHIQIQKLTMRQVQMFYSELLEKLSPGSVIYIHTVLHAALKHAVKESLVTKNVCQGVKLPRRVKRQPTVLSLEQASQLLGAIRTDRFRVLLTLAITTAMREGELLALKWQDIDWEKHQLQVCRNLVRVRGRGLVEVEPKTAHSRRTIALPTFVLDLLREYRVKQQGMRLRIGASWQEHDLVFCVWYGGPINASFLLRSFKKMLIDAGLPHIRFHDLRHSAVTILLEMGVPAQVVQELAGHSDISTTLGIYGHVLPGQQEKIARKWDNTLGDSRLNGRRELLRQQWQTYPIATQERLENILETYGEEAARLALEAIDGL